MVRPGLPDFGRVPGQLSINQQFDPRKVQVEVDPDSGIYVSTVTVGEITLGTGYRTTLGRYAQTSMMALYHQRWLEKSRSSVNSLGTNTPVAHAGLSLPIPVDLPKPIQSLLGPGGPALNVSGSESIKLSGTSDWSNQQTGILGQRRSLFPSLDMQQDLNIQLEGQLSDRVKVNLLQNSASQVPLSNRIAINYHGEEDDLVQELDLGNTSLSLPGTQYVSYSGKNEGLFGVKVASRFGPLDLTALASKQEGRSERASYSGGASRNTQTLADLDYVKGQYFLLYDPNPGQLYNISIPSIQVWKDDANYGNDVQTQRGRAVIDPDHVMGIPVNAVQDTAGFRGSFDLLKPGADQDYEVIPNYYFFGTFSFLVLRLKQPIPLNTDQCLAVTYTATPINGSGIAIAPDLTVGGRVLATTGPDSGFVLLKLLRAPRSRLTSANAADPNNSLYDSTGAFFPTRELELKNFYQLSGFGIDPTTFKLTIQQGQTGTPVTSAQLGDQSVPYIEVLGLDNFDESTGHPIQGHDNKIDGSSPSSGSRLFIDYQNGVLFFPDPRPFGPRVLGPSAQRFDKLMDQVLFRRARLDSLGPLIPNPGIYDKYNVNSFTDATYYITADFAASRGGGDISLGRGAIIEGSDVVTVNGERWTRDRDYTIDYDLGRISLKRQLGPSDQLNIDYSYAPLFQQAGRTLIGSAFRLEGRDKSLGGALLYDSRGAQDLRPRLGEEPSRTVITDLNTDFKFKPNFLTRLADHLPGVHTTTPSDLEVQAEAGASFPNPNTLGEVYIDDMEGVRDAVSLIMDPSRWRYMSVPRRAQTVVNGLATTSTSMLGLPQQHNAEIHWYSPPNVVLENQLKPSLTDAQGGKQPHTVLALSVPRRPLSANVADSLWAGLVYPLDQVGLDLSRSQFIEVWINDFDDKHEGDQIPRVRGNHVKLHLDLGTVSEDQMRAPDRPPNNLLDTEDQGPPRDHQLTVTDTRNEDTGYDGITDPQEIAAGVPVADLTTAGPDDPEGDDWRTTDGSFQDIDPRKWRYINGTEGNKTIFPYPDTEDLNLNDILDTQEDYYEYTVDLSDGPSPYLVTDVRKDFAGTPGLADDNGWRRYRIPISDSLRVQFGAPDLTVARHLRLWLEGIQKSDSSGAPVRKPLVMLGGVDIVGNRWLQSDLSPAQKDSLHTTMTLNTVNTLDNADVYKAPFDPGQTLNGSQSLTRREQSMSMEFTQLGAGDTLEAYHTFSIDEDYSRYGALDWYASAFEIPTYNQASDSLFYFLRFASDERGQNYYEIKRKVPPSSQPLAIDWEEVKVEIAQMSNFKLASNFPQLDPILYRAAFGAPGDSIVIVGRPSFTRLRRLSFGLINAHQVRPDNPSLSRVYPSGQLWFDELRATDVAKDVGYANRVLVNGHVANLLSYNVAWNSQDADFLSVGQARGSGSVQTGFAVTSEFDVHRFFEGTGIQMPVNFVYNRQSSKPRFTAGDDVVRTGEQQAASETRSDTKTISTSYTRNWSEHSNPFLRYTLGGITANLARSESDGASPSGLSNAVSVAGGVNYNIAPRSLLALPMPWAPSKVKFFPLPERVYWNYSVSTNRSSNFTRALDGSNALLPSSAVNGRTANINFGMDTRPFDLISHHIEGQRALTLDGVPMDHLGFVNFGRVVSWRQSFSSRYALQKGPWLKPSFQWSSSYAQNNDVQSNLAYRSIGNGQNVTMNWDLPFDQLVKGAAGTSGSGGPTFAPAVVHDTSRAGRDSTRAKPHVPWHRPGWRDLFSRVGAVSTDMSLNRSSAYSRLSGTPSFLYLLGLADDPGFADSTKHVRAADGNTGQTGLQWRANARTRVPVVYGSSLTMHGSVGDQISQASGVVTRTADWRFPDLEVDYGNVAEALHLTRYLTSPQLRTAWNHAESRDFQGTTEGLIGISSSNDFQPLLSLRGSFKNGTTADFSLNSRSTRRESFQVGHSTQTDNNTDVNLTLGRNYTQGQKVKFLGKTSTVRTNINLQLSTVYSHREGGTIVEGSPTPVSPIDQTRLSVNGTGSYGFSSNVTGSTVLGYSENRDRALGSVQRSVRVEVRAQFTF